MKKFIAAFAIAAVAATASISFTGCQTVQPEDVYALSYGAGAAAGVVVRMQDGIDTNTIAIICEVAPQLKKIVPSTNETWQAAWKQAGKAAADILVKEGKIDAQAAQLITIGAGTAGLALDYLFARHPDWLQSQECVSAAVSGIVDGFVEYVKPSPSLSAGAVDQDALLFLTSAVSIQKK